MSETTAACCGTARAAEQASACCDPVAKTAAVAAGCCETDAAALIGGALPDVLGADRDLHAGRHTVVVGAGHSAANTLLALAELAERAPGTRITWATRGATIDRALGGGDADALPGRGALGTGIRLLIDSGRVDLVTGFAVHAIRIVDGRAELTALDGRTLTADRVVSATGFRPDHSIAGELRLDLDPALGCTRALAPLIDPNEHSCGTVRPHGVDGLTQPEPGYFVVGMKSYGRAPHVPDGHRLRAGPFHRRRAGRRLDRGP